MRLLSKIAAAATVHALVVALFTIICLHPVNAEAESCQYINNPVEWTRAVKRAAFPENNTEYYFIQFHNDPDAPVMLTLSGEFPYARYIGFTLYSIDNEDQGEGDPIKFNGKVQHLTDIEIQADAQNRNPYLNGVDRYAESRNYTIYIVKEGSHRIDSSGEPDANTLVIPDDISDASLFLRIYVPDNKPEGLQVDDTLAPQGWVELPTITATVEPNEPWTGGKRGYRDAPDELY